MIDFYDEYGVMIAVTAEVDEESEAVPVDANPGFRPRRAFFVGS